MISGAWRSITFVLREPTRSSHSQQNHLARNCHLGEARMKSTVVKIERQGKRTKAVLPVRVKGIDTAGNGFEELAHTLDITTSGVRLGAIRRELNRMDEVTLFFRQRKLQFRVVWTKKMKGSSEFQVGLQAVGQEREPWGLSFSEFRGEALAASRPSEVFSPS